MKKDDWSAKNLRLIVAYWCNHVAPDYEDRFFWAYEQVDDIVHEVGEPARALLVALAQTAPDDHNAAYLAAGPLEDYINVVVAHKLADEAACILHQKHLKPLLPYVWGNIEKLEPLAAKSSARTTFNEPDLTKYTRVIDAKTLMGFWCHTCVSSIVEDYKDYYQQVLAKLFDTKTRPDAMHDLLLSAPDEKAAQYLHDAIFVLHK